MIALLQRVSSASVSVGGESIGAIDQGLLALVAIHRDDQPKDVRRLAERILGYRVFPDAEGRMNLSLTETAGGLLLVPQFTLAADTGRGMRPSFGAAAAPDEGRDYFSQLATICAQRLGRVETGQFGANMEVSLVNTGPVTFWIES